MIITDNIVFLNFPKTGSSFVRQVIKDIYANRINKNIITKNLFKLGISKLGYQEILVQHPNVPDYKDQHGTYDQIPERHKNNQIVSVIRNPFNRFLSLYNFGWWKNNPILDKTALDEHLPHFPDLSIDDFVVYDRLLTKRLKQDYNIPEGTDIGGQTIEFIQMFFKNHKELLKTLDNTYLDSDDYKKSFIGISLLQQENLNNDLSNLLSQNKYSAQEVDFAKNYKKINVTKSDSSASLSPTSREYILSTERLLFRILDSKGIHYD